VLEGGGSQEVVRLIATPGFKMKDACILCNIIEICLRRKVIKTKRGRLFDVLKFQLALAQSWKNMSACLCRDPNISITRRKNGLMGC
jgi:hypothetical protein